MDISKIWLGLAVRGLALHKTVCTRLQTKRPTLVFLSAFLVFPSHQITKSGLIGSVWFRYDEELTLKTSASSPLKSRTKSDTSTRLTPDFRLSIPHRQGTASQINLSSVLLQLIKRTTSQSFTAINKNTFSKAFLQSQNKCGGSQIYPWTYCCFFQYIDFFSEQLIFLFQIRFSLK